MKSAKVALLIFSFLALMANSLYAQDVTIVYSGQTHAMLYPCSCPIRQDGGIGRRATLVKKLRKEYPGLLLLDCGGFTAGGQLDEYTQNIQLDMQRSEVNYKALELMQYDAVGISSDEFNFGRDFFLKNAKKTNPAFLSVNLDTDKIVPYIIKDSGGVKIAIIGLTGLSANYKSEGLKISAPSQIAELVSRLKNTGVQVLIALSTQGESEDLKLISKIKGIDIIFVGDKPLKEEALTKIETTFILRPAWQGRKLGKLTLKIKDGKLSDCTIDELALSDNLKNDSDIARILPRCYSDVNCKEANLAGTCQNPGALNAACLFVKPDRIDLFIINVKDCVTCNTEPVINLLRKKFPGLIIKSLDYPGLPAQKMIKDLSLQVLPAYIFPKSVESQDNFESIKSDLQLINDFYLFKPQASGISYFLNQTLKKGNFDLFFSLFYKDSTLLLTTLKEFNPSLHFLTTEMNEGFDAKNGVFEVEENLRAVCVQKYQPEKFWDYLICRSKNIKSAYWEDCLGGVDPANVKSCARGMEGAKLLRENIGLNKKLQVIFGPSYLLNNQEIFSSRGVPSKEELGENTKEIEGDEIMTHKPKIYLLDVTNRDGVQTSRICLSKLQKTMINWYLDQMGVYQSEFGFPLTRHETNYLNANLALAQLGGFSRIRLSGWLRATKDDVKIAFKLVPHLKYLNLSISTSDQMIVHKFKGKLDHQSIIQEMQEAVSEAKKAGSTCVGVNAEDASRTNLEYLVEFALKAKEAGADRIRYCDTLGTDTPFSIYERIELLARKVQLPIEVHCHNDLGLVVANSIAGARAASDAGVDSYINTCVNGMGERAGNADLVSVILAIKYGQGMSGYDLDEKVNLKMAWKICKYASYAFGVPIPINQPGVGANAFAHESGIHADGALKDRRNYELYDFEELGRGEPEIIETGRKITAGEYSGIKGFRNVYEKLEVAFKDDAEATRILELVRYANVHNQKPLVDDELNFIAKYPDIAHKIFTMTP